MWPTNSFTKGKEASEEYEEEQDPDQVAVGGGDQDGEKEGCIMDVKVEKKRILKDEAFRKEENDLIVESHENEEMNDNDDAELDELEDLEDLLDASVKMEQDNEVTGENSNLFEMVNIFLLCNKLLFLIGLYGNQSKGRKKYNELKRD